MMSISVDGGRSEKNKKTVLNEQETDKCQVMYAKHA